MHEIDDSLPTYIHDSRIVRLGPASRNPRLVAFFFIMAVRIERGLGPGKTDMVRATDMPIATPVNMSVAASYTDGSRARITTKFNLPCLARCRIVSSGGHLYHGRSRWKKKRSAGSPRTPPQGTRNDCSVALGSNGESEGGEGLTCFKGPGLSMSWKLNLAT